MFEPLPANADRIRKLIALNPLRVITLHASAIADTDAEMDLMIMPETSMAKLEVSQFQVDHISEIKLRILVRSIDSIVAAGEAPPPHLMKIDVEGSEMLVLNGAINTIRNHHPEIFAEVHSTALLSQCGQLLQGEGYAIEHLDDARAVARTTNLFRIRAFVTRAK